jgi:hypothetical protein
MEGGARLARPVLPLAATAALCGLILVYGQGFFRPRATPLPAVASAFAPSAASPGRAAAATSPSTPTTQAAADTSAAVAPQTVAAGRTRAGFRLPRPPRTETRLPLYLGLAVALGVWLLALLKRPDVVVHDTDEFRRALRAWSPYIVAARRPTPRAAKKFLNRVRYYAMRQSAHAPPDTLLARLKALPFRSRRLKVLLRRLGFRAPRARRADDALSEELLVALAAVQECAPDTLDEPGFYTRFDEFLDELGQVSKDAHRRVRELGYVAVITEAQRRQFARISAGIRMS